MSAYAIYRLPYADEATLIQQTEGEPAELLSCTELNGKSGFVVAPFQITVQQPILLIRPDKVEKIEVRGKWQEVRGERQEVRTLASSGPMPPLRRKGVLPS